MGTPINYGDPVWVTNMTVGDGSNNYLRIDSYGNAIVSAGTDFTWEILLTTTATGPITIDKNSSSFFAPSIQEKSVCDSQWRRFNRSSR